MDINAATYSDQLMIISPPAEVMEVIDKYKRASARVIGDFNGLHSKAHISVAHQFRQMAHSTEPKLDSYQRLIHRVKPVTLCINGFNYFKHGHTGATIYAKIELSPEVTNWFNHIKRVFGEKKRDAVPHITIAKNIPVEQFQVLWPKFIDQRYRFDLTPQSITVLSRATIGGRDKYWTPVRELYFNNFG